jgi:hypothetical protein
MVVVVVVVVVDAADRWLPAERGREALVAKRAAKRGSPYRSGSRVPDLVPPRDVFPDGNA